MHGPISPTIKILKRYIFNSPSMKSNPLKITIFPCYISYILYYIYIYINNSSNLAYILCTKTKLYGGARAVKGPRLGKPLHHPNVYGLVLGQAKALDTLSWPIIFRHLPYTQRPNWKIFFCFWMNAKIPLVWYENN